MSICRCYLQLDGGDKIPVRPNYKSDLSLDYELETNQRFYRKKLSGKLTFVSDDYKLINSAPFETTFNFYIEESNDYGVTFKEIYKSRFFKTDCTFNEDDQNISVQPETEDEYNDVLAGMEKEYNLMELAPEAKFVTINKRPLIQVYVPGDTIVSCFLGGTHWEQDANEVVDQKKIVEYHFALCNILKEIKITANGSPAVVQDVYAGKMAIESSSDGNTFTGNLYSSNNTSYYIYVSVRLVNFVPVGDVLCEIRKLSDDTVLFRYEKLVEGEFDNMEFDFVAVEGSGATGTMHADMKSYNTYARYLCDVEKIGEKETYPLADDDIVPDNRNYNRAIGYNIDVAFISNNFSDEPTEWGLADNGKYFAPPKSIYGQKFYPIARSTWRYASIWFGFYLMDWLLEQQARKPYTFRDSYTLSSCINVLLKEFAPGIKHEGTAEYSQFLYGDNPIHSEKFTLLLTQKGNILNGEYKTPAQKAPITLQQITDMLKNVFKCYWYIEDGKFKIEHVEFFRNGGSYNSSQVIGTDLTKLENVRSGKKWAFGTSSYSFDKVDMPERYQFAWMDDVTNVFEGFPIEVESKYVTAGKIEDINVSNFTSDIDLLLLNPSAMSTDGFALFAAVEPSGGGQLELPIINIDVDGTEYYLQNGYLAYAWLHPKFWVYDMPARRIKINDSTRSARSIERKKKQSINFPTDLNINPISLVKTYIGNGQVEKLSVNLSSRTAKATLKYDTE